MIKLFLRALRKLRLIQHLNLIFTYTVHGRAYSIPVKGGVGFDHFLDAEQWMLDVLKKLLALQPNKAFLDVGVNIGQTLLTVKSIQNDVPYFGFEPNPICVSYVADLVEANRLKASVYPVGMSNASGLAVLYKDVQLPGDSSASMIKEFRDTQGKVELFVPVLSWDLIPAREQAIQFGIVKIDVEGAEWEVLSGLTELLEQQRPFIICELLPVYTSDNTFRLERQGKILQLLQRLNYSIFRIGLDAKLIPLHTIEVHSNLADCNYVFAPVERATAISNTK
jgi:FkbM family methyltransferase